MPYVQIPIDEGFYKSSTLALANLNSNNLYPNNPQTRSATSTGSSFRTPGIKEAVYGTSGGIGRGLHKYQKEDWLFYVSGNKLFKKISLLANIEIAGVITGSNNVVMADNGETLCIIVPGLAGYFYDIATDTLTQITDPVFLDFMAQDGGVTSVVEHNNRFVYTTDLEFFIGSLVEQNKGRDFDALDFEDAESSNDPIVRVMESANEVYIFNTETTEVYKDVGGIGEETFPYLRVPGATIDRGLKSRFGIVEVNESFIFLGNGFDEQPAIFQTGKGASNKISTTAIDELIQSYPDHDLEQVNAWTYAVDGAVFIGFNLPNQTIVLDLTATAMQGSPVWHTRTSNEGRYSVNQTASIFGTIIVNNIFNDRLGELSRNTTTEYGQNITRELDTGYIITNGRSFVISSVQLTVKSGIGTPLNNPIPAGYNPQVEMLFSIDQGNTFNSMGSVSMGNTGEFILKPTWRRIGRTDQSIMFKFRTDAPVPLDFIRLDVDIQQGM